MTTPNFSTKDDPCETKLIFAYVERYAKMNVFVNGVFEKQDLNFWAYEKLCNVVQENPDKAFAIILSILDITNDEYVLSNLAAGPLEDLLRIHGPLVIEAIEKRSKNDRRFRELLGQVNKVSSDCIWSRIEEAASQQ